MVGDPCMEQARLLSAYRKHKSSSGIIGSAFAGGVSSCARPVVQAISASAALSCHCLNRFIFPSLRACARLLLAPRHNRQCDKCNQRSVFAARDGRAVMLEHPAYCPSSRLDDRTRASISLGEGLSVATDHASDIRALGRSPKECRRCLRAKKLFSSGLLSKHLTNIRVRR